MWRYLFNSVSLRKMIHIDIFRSNGSHRYFSLFHSLYEDPEAINCRFHLTSVLVWFSKDLVSSLLNQTVYTVVAMVLNFCYLDANETSNIQEHFVSVRSEDSRKMNLDLK